MLRSHLWSPSSATFCISLVFLVNLVCSVNWQGKGIATITLPPVYAAANVGVPEYVT
jgi:hypothetical protein